MNKKQPPEFYDLSERILNSGDAYWGNLGYWQEGNDYSEACKGLAQILASTVTLDEHSSVFDAGFGCGDQLLLWLKEYRVKFLSGINYSVSQTSLAKERVNLLGFKYISETLYQGDIGELSNYTHIMQAGINTVLALDCAYHFPSREKFLIDSYQLLANSNNHDKGSVIGLTDIVLGEGRLSWWRKTLLKIMLRLSDIPLHNIITLDAYKKQLQQVGFDQVHSEDISDQVFIPFGDWLASPAGQQKISKGNLAAKLKYKVTSTFLAWAYRNNILRYIVISAKKD